jgi:hypothetical protein
MSAWLVVACGLGTVCTRVMWVRRRAVLLVWLALAAGLAAHAHFMLTVRFDYGWHVKLCVLLGFATAVGWVTWSVAVRHPGRRLLSAFLLLVHVAMLFELLDFPPLWGALDAHAVWHCCTVPLTPLFYAWVARDAAWVEAMQKLQ